MSRILLSSVAAVAMLASAHGAAAQTEIQCWHAMGGKLGDAVNALADSSTSRRRSTRSYPVYKGSYTETLTAAIAAFRAKQRAAHRAGLRGRHRQHDGRQGRGLSGPPGDGGRQGAVRSQGLHRPGLRLLLDDRRQAAVDAVQLLDAGALLEQGAASRRPASIPTSRPRPGRSWARWPRRLVAVGAKCGFTPQWQTWTMIENFGAWHNLPYRHQGQRLRRHRHRAQVQRRRRASSTSRCWPTGARTSASSMAAARASRRRCSRRRVRHAHRLVGPRGGHREGARQGQGRHRHDAVLDPT